MVVIRRAVEGAANVETLIHVLLGVAIQTGLLHCVDGVT